MSDMAYQTTLDFEAKVERSIEQMKLASAMSERYYGKPILICYSGGKDSDALLGIAEESGVEFEVMHSLTTADAPETVRHVRKVFARLRENGIECEIRRPTYKGKPVTMWSLIPQKSMPPTRLVRYCCSVLKETGGKGRAIATGVRRAESAKRRGRAFANNSSRSRPAFIDFEDAAQLFENADSPVVHDNDFIRSCRIRGKTSFQPILEWLDGDVWAYIESRGIDPNPLYAEGWKRIGCIGCPIAGKSREKEFERWPKYKEAYLRSFGHLLERRAEEGKPTEWEDAQEVFDWWMEK